jgi:hypothetical protein
MSDEKAPLPPTDERLDDLEHQIDELREDERVQEAVHGSFYDPDERLYESGDERGREDDDQTIAPG